VPDGDHMLSSAPARAPRRRPFALAGIAALIGMGIQISAWQGASAAPVARAGTTAGGRAVAGQTRQAWVWHPGDPSSLASAAAKAHVTELLVWVSPRATQSAAELRKLSQLKAAAAAYGENLVALCGDPSWAANPAAAGSWAREIARTKDFQRIHLDIEPHALPQWSSNTAVLAQGLLKAVGAAEAAGLPTDVDIPYWYDTVRLASGQPLDEAVMRIADGVTIMSYQNTAAKIVAVSAAEMQHASALGVPAHIGINLIPPGSDGPTSSLYGQSAAAISKQIGQVQAAGARWTTFAGLALHDSDYLRGITA
jgi:hypothetical protein